uniref:DUF4276 family protein n=1 Tax=Candidatus Kentrum sp. MB TaxID=2138164 RepID=A0A451B8Q2_9GAMM|nr:MAG: protein of unknown function (DUF4276) [Candidatus Kentron sp. MB]VFK31464.1 MAG: protein of unknown function (DUF4276) [Candidatus Kentron sp. MB]VFK74642.1 MAG: protein of unknown function (DUF4276) [Candidatus Kentron sp. MB]
MHFEILVEDQSGKRALDILVPKIIGDGHTFKVHSYKGIGRIPKKLTAKSDPGKCTLLAKLPRLLKGYGKTLAGRGSDYSEAVIVVCDLDDKCLKAFRQDLLAVLDACNPRPETRFCIAIEEGEAWFLGDIPAVKAAYPKARDKVLDEYENDSICGTWERLADAVFSGGAAALTKKGGRGIGAEKFRWAEKISPHMDVSNNASPSFVYFRDKLRKLCAFQRW